MTVDLDKLQALADAGVDRYLYLEACREAVPELIAEVRRLRGLLYEARENILKIGEKWLRGAGSDKDILAMIDALGAAVKAGAPWEDGGP